MRSRTRSIYLKLRDRLVAMEFDITSLGLYTFIFYILHFFNGYRTDPEAARLMEKARSEEARPAEHS